MKWFHNMTVGKRLFSVILTAVLGAATVAGLGVVELNRVYTAANFANINVVPSLVALGESTEALSVVRVLTLQHVLNTDPASMTKLDEKISVTRAKVEDGFKKYDPLVADDKDGKMLAANRSAMAEYDAVREKVLALSRQGKKEEATQMAQGDLFSAGGKIAAAMAEHRVYNIELAQEGAARAEAIMDRAMWIMAVVVAATLITVVLLGVLMTRKLLQQLGGEPAYAADVAGQIAAGNLSISVETRESDRTSLMFAMKTMRDSLAGIVAQVRSGTDTIASASSQIAGGNLDLSSRTEEQASSLEETASSMEELTSTVKQNADNARQANHLASSASEVAGKGGAVMDEVVQTMDSINESAKKIVDIIAVIDGIAFQTNILALNAAVEAARAGEQGRGFAVVASEVRNLAQRSAAAAKEIKALISDSVEKVDGGTRLVNQAGGTMQEIVESVKRVTDIMAEITAATQEQTSGIEQINQAIVQMDEVTQQNASLVEEAAAASESLQDQAKSLAQVVSVFKLNAADQAAQPVAKAVTAAGRAALPARPGVAPKKKALSSITPAAKSAHLKIAASAASGRDIEWEEF